MGVHNRATKSQKSHSLLDLKKPRRVWINIMLHYKDKHNYFLLSQVKMPSMQRACNHQGCTEDAKGMPNSPKCECASIMKDTCTEDAQGMPPDELFKWVHPYIWMSTSLLVCKGCIKHPWLHPQSIPCCIPCIPGCIPSCIPCISGCIPCIPGYIPVCIPCISGCIPCIPGCSPCIPGSIPGCIPCIPGCIPCIPSSSLCMLGYIHPTKS